ncbi:antitoxin [Amycolatopsis pigmentata]|uniref:Antitoxin n=1 Tax=Amycolatopsis pigmentata TaxID=450801 RepID=A0ABW5FTG4_9PSEU
MGINFDELKKKAQETFDQNAGKLEQGIDKASGFAKSKFGQHSAKIDDVSTKAKDLVHKNTSEGRNGGNPER